MRYSKRRSDSTESQKYPQWALNPSTYQNMANDQVDWAALAQQWIIMKEAGPPPIPEEQPVALNNKPKARASEGGEAPMEVENDKEEPPAWNVSEPPPPPGAEAWNWNAQSQSWNWNNSWVQPSGVPPPPTIGPMKSALLPTPNNMYTAPPESSSDNAVPFGGYNAGSNTEYNNTGYWTGSNNHKHIKPHNKRYSKVNVPIRTTAPIPPMPVPLDTPAPALDAAKRKQLPAWIREGLEKMEKDKLKQLEKEKEKQVRDEFLQKNKQTEKETMEILKSTMKERQRSKFESDGENSDSEKDARRKAVTPDPIPLTQDELMLKVRRMMTEILLNVTNRQIEAICKEEHQRFLKKYKASDHRSSAPSGANISARLGLGMYGGGSGSSSEEDDDDYQRNDKDSDSELKDTIKRKMADFQKTEREIEERLEEAERRKAGSASRSSSPESMDNDSQVDARVQGRKYHTDEKSPPRSRNFHDKSRARSFSSSSEGSDYSNNRSKNSRRSSSSDSNDSHKKSKKKQHSRSRSRSPDKKRQNSLSSRWSRSRSPPKRHSRSDSRSRRDSNGSKKKSSRRSRSRSYSRSRRSRSSSYRKSKRSRTRSRSRGRFRRTRSRERSVSRSRYSKRSRSRSNGRRSRRRRSRSSSSGRGKRSQRH
ncbi:arginine/serine-rich protein PNISR isoform X2 [Anoplophora glabripennis]|uniref:arginine/serine-rich protein PNISR isoform X2 n=1 Tax=Anoplophora glabripennis TaxID=217634 RepID=UPI00087532BD|nr:arginine/serine-rich protein PNISR isoform X2 [Anoplophora glabripennis]